jgi:CrcB protein
MQAALTNAFLVGIGGFFGSVFRYWMSSWVHTFVSQPWRPAGTLVVNIIGCFLIGLLMGLADSRQLLKPDMRLLLVVGVLGGFTTFSAFGYETFALLRDRAIAGAILNVSAHILLGLLAVWMGFSMTRST